MTLNGEPIQDAPRARETVDPGIASDLSFVEWEAGTAAGLNMWKWENTDTYTRAFKARVIAWYQLHKMVKLRSEIAVQRKSKRKGKK